MPHQGEACWLPFMAQLVAPLSLIFFRSFFLFLMAPLDGQGQADHITLPEGGDAVQVSESTRCRDAHVLAPFADNQTCKTARWLPLPPPPPSRATSLLFSPGRAHAPLCRFPAAQKIAQGTRGKDGTPGHHRGPERVLDLQAVSVAL